MIGFDSLSVHFLGCGKLLLEVIIMSRKKMNPAGGQPIGWRKGPEKDFKIRFVSVFTGEVRGVKRVKGHEIRGGSKPTIHWSFDGKVGGAEKVDGHWETFLWDDAEHFLRFPDTASWIIRNFGIREVK
jgi:hypothetical protein